MGRSSRRPTLGVLFTIALRSAEALRREPKEFDEYKPDFEEAEWLGPPDAAVRERDGAEAELTLERSGPGIWYRGKPDADQPGKDPDTPEEPGPGEADADHEAPIPIPEPNGRHAVIISSIGPDSRYGCGVRQMVMMMDLWDCGYKIDMVTEFGGMHRPDLLTNPAYLYNGWTTRTPKTVFEHVTWYNKTEFVDLEKYTDIYFFGWLWEYHWKKGPQFQLLPRLGGKLRDRTYLCLDDVPDVRCQAESMEYDPSYCRTVVPRMMKRWASVVSQIFTLTSNDVVLVKGFLDRINVTGFGPGTIREWPMRIKHMVTFQKEEAPPTSDTEEIQKSYLTMVANDHATNKEFAEKLFSAGVIEKWCHSKVTVMFVGTIGKYINKIRRKYSSVQPSCVITAGVQSDKVLMQKIMPRTLAVLNPFWKDLHSGVSVKSFGALAAGVPLVTSIHGLRGLQECGAPELALGRKEADDVEQYVDFVTRLIVDAHMYELLCKDIIRLQSDCIQHQERTFPADMCFTPQPAAPRGNLALDRAAPEDISEFSSL